MKKLRKFALLILAAALLAAGCNLFSPPPPPEQFIPSQVQQDRAPQPTGAQKVFSYRGVAGQSALSLLKQSHRVETKDFGRDLGEFVVSIDSIKPAGDEFWAFYVNGKSSTIGASSYKTQDRDVIEWKLEKVSSK